jgi:tetratricopeptide (TPR) repeat protein
MSSNQGWLGKLGCLLPIALLGLFLVPKGLSMWSAKIRYGEGIDAYNAGKCPDAIAAFAKFTPDNLGEDERAKLTAVTAECEALIAAQKLQATGKSEGAWKQYVEFVNRYDTGTMVTVRQQVNQLRQKSSLTALATPEACSAIDRLKQVKLFSDADLPNFHAGCADNYTQAGNFDQASIFYEQFIDRFPKHPSLETVKAKWIQSMVAEAKAKNGGVIPQPLQSGRTGSRDGAILIRNDSPEKMRIVFSGATPRVEELEGCKDCEVYKETAPQSCPNKGPTGRYVVAPGRYDVVVKSIGGGSVRPFTGSWAIDGGVEYQNCFYIVRSSSSLPDASAN